MSATLEMYATLSLQPMTKSKKTQDLAEYISSILEEKQLTEPKAAEKTGKRIKQNAINALKNGRVLGENSKIKTLFYLARALGVSPVEVFTRALGVTFTELGIKEELLDETIGAILVYLLNLPEKRRKDILIIVNAFAEENTNDASIVIEVPKTSISRSRTDEEKAQAQTKTSRRK